MKRYAWLALVALAVLPCDAWAGFGGKVIPLGFRTSTTANVYGFVDSLTFSGVSMTESTHDTSVAVSLTELYEYLPAFDGDTDVDSLLAFSLVVVPSSRTSVGEAGDSLYLFVDFSLDGINWVQMAVNEFAVAEFGTTNSWYHTFVVPSSTARQYAALVEGTPVITSPFLPGGFLRIIIRHDANGGNTGEWTAYLKGWGPPSPTDN